MPILTIKDKLAKLVPQWQEEVKRLNKAYGDKKFDEVTVSQALGGVRDVKVLPCDTSYLDPQEGIRFRNLTIPEVRDRLPRSAPGAEPYPLGIWLLLLTGEVPTKDEVLEVEAEVKRRQRVPQYVYDMIRALPVDLHPMSQISMAVLALQKESVFARRYSAGMKKSDYWDATFEDSLTLLARLPVVAAYIYRRNYKGDTFIAPDETLDWGSNYAHMMGYDGADYQNLMRLYLLLHSDHESGNVSAHTGFLVNSALSDPYYAISAALNGLAGPLHGLANQECLKWVLDMLEAHGGRHVTLTKEQVKAYTEKTLASGKVVPGYGHAVLRKTDPRFTAQREFALKNCPTDPVVAAVGTVFEVVPEILGGIGKIKNPWPNVDAHSGCLQYHYGVTEFDYYTVLFGVSRAMGITAQLVWSRAIGFPIERPKSITIQMIRDAFEKK